MIETIFIIDKNLNSFIKEFFTERLKSTCQTIEVDFSTDTFEQIQTQIYELYQECEVLGDSMKLNNVLLFNSHIEYTNVLHKYLLQEPSGILQDVEFNDPSLNTWNGLCNLIDFCRTVISVQSFDIFDVNHLIYAEEWSILMDLIKSRLTIDKSGFFKLNTLSDIFSLTPRDGLFNQSNWLEFVLGELYMNATVSTDNDINWIGYYFDDTKVGRYLNKQSEQVNTLDLTMVKNKIHTFHQFTNVNDQTYYTGPIVRDGKCKLLLIPLIEQENNEEFASLLNRIESQHTTCPILIHPEESVESFSMKYNMVMKRYIGEFDTSISYEMFLGVYLRPYWNNVFPPKREIKLSNKLNTIPLDINDDTPIVSNANILSNIVDLVQSTHPQINHITFEIFNMTQNFNQSLDIIFSKLSEVEHYFSFVSFQYSYAVGIYDVSNVEIVNKTFDTNTSHPFLEEDQPLSYCEYNFISYMSGNKQYNLNVDEHNIEQFLNSFRKDQFYLMDYVELTKINNIILINERFSDQFAYIQQALTPNTLLLPYSSEKDTFEIIKQKLKMLNEEPHIDI